MTELDTVRGAAPGAAGPALRQQQVEPVTLVQFPPIWGRNVSPFGLKLEAWLTLANIPFDIRTTMRLDKAPKGKLPYIIDQGHAIGDTSLIIAHLKHTRGIDPDAGLTPAERAQGLALQRLFEEHLYFIIVYSRWIDEEGWPLVAEAFFAEREAAPAPRGPVLVPRARAQDALHAGPGPARAGRDLRHGARRPRGHR